LLYRYKLYSISYILLHYCIADSILALLFQDKISILMLHVETTTLDQETLGITNYLTHKSNYIVKFSICF
jgi:hypothetical protein